MGIFSSLFGAAIGGMFGGPLGAILGYAIGSNINTNTHRGSSYSQRDLQTAFTIALVSLAAKVAKADGKVCENEIDAFDHFLKCNLNMSVQERQHAAKIFNAARDSTYPPEDFAKQLKSIFSQQSDRLRDVITILYMIGFADGQIHPSEEELIKDIGLAMGLNLQDIQQCRATLDSVQSNHRCTIDEAYQVLGVSPNDSDKQIKSAHRKLVREYHPDKLASKGLPKDFNEFAKQKMVAINEAWDMIKSKRCL